MKEEGRYNSVLLNFFKFIFSKRIDCVGFPGDIFRLKFFAQFIGSTLGNHACEAIKEIR